MTVTTPQTSAPVDEAASAPGPLAGLTVLDFTQVMMGPCCTQLLGDYGADVIKIEKPPSGDLSRTSIADVAGPDNPIYLSLNRNKRSIVADLRRPEDRERIRELASTADIIVSNFRPGVMERLGLGYQELSAINPRLIWAAGSGFGSTGPLAGRGGQDVIAQAYSGVMRRDPRADDQFAPYPTTVCDYTTGMHLMQGLLMALYHRERTGRGQRIEVNMLDSMLHMQMQEAAMELNRGYEINWATMPLTGVFRTTDSAVCVVGAFKDDALSRISRALGLASDLTDDERFCDRPGLDANRAVLHEILGTAIAERDTAYWLSRLEAEDVLCAPVRTLPEALSDEQAVANNVVIEMQHPHLGAVRLVKAPIGMSETPASYRTPPPTIGQHSEHR